MLNRQRLLKGITIPELLIGVLIIGVVIAIFVYALGVQRTMARDSKRVSDISVLRASLGQYWLQKATYPTSDGIYIGEPGGAERLGGNGFTTAEDPTPPILLDRVPVGPKSNEYYAYRGGQAGYSLMFATERETAYGPAGTYFAHSVGVDTLDEIK
ncbi:MAG: type II secretion system protein [Patescibacteria group bacterium]|nr:type II secretion system protein [Patescibacteria group bacterium]